MSRLLNELISIDSPQTEEGAEVVPKGDEEGVNSRMRSVEAKVLGVASGLAPITLEITSADSRCAPFPISAANPLSREPLPSTLLPPVTSSVATPTAKDMFVDAVQGPSELPQSPATILRVIVAKVGDPLARHRWVGTRVPNKVWVSTGWVFTGCVGCVLDSQTCQSPRFAPGRARRLTLSRSVSSASNSVMYTPREGSAR